MKPNIKGFLLMVELRAGAKLYRYPQLIGGVAWALVGARMVPASLDETCEQLLREGWLEPQDDGSYTWWELNRDAR